MGNRDRKDRRNVTREDIFLKSRMLSEGVQIDLKETPAGLDTLLTLEEIEERQSSAPIEIDLNSTDFATSAMKQQEGLGFTECYLGNVIILNRAQIAVPIVPKTTSRLTLTLYGNRATISEADKLLAEGTYFSPNASQPWSGRRLSNGLTIETALLGTSPGIVNVLFSLSCYNHNSGQACRYCGLFANKISESVDAVPLKTLHEYARIQAEAIEIMTSLGWRGVVAVGGGALSPATRDGYLDRLETVMEPLHDRLEPKILRELHLVYNHYPPPDFADFHRIREMGIQSTSIDMEVVTPEAFQAICPGKHAYRPLEYWKEAQEAALEASLISATNIVAGLERKEVLLEGIQERLSKGVFPVPLQFLPAPGSAMAHAKPRSAEWIVDVAEQVAKAYIHSFTKVTGPFGRSAAKSFMRKLAPRALRPLMPRGWDVPRSHSMPMPINCVAFDELVRQVHRIPGGRFVPLPNLGIQQLGCEAF